MNMLNLIPNKTFQWRAQEGRWIHDDIYAYIFFKVISIIRLILIWIYYNDSIKRVRSLTRRTEKLFLTSPCIADYHPLMSFQLPVETSVLIHVILFLNDFMSIFSATVILKLENFAFILHLLCLKQNLAVSSACSEVQSAVVCVCQFQTPNSLPSYFPLQ